MLKPERYKKILNILDEKETVSIQELCDVLGASRATVRRDLLELETEQLLQRTHGGAVAFVKPAAADIPLTLRRHIRRDEKEKIACMALSYIEEGDTIYIGAGSTMRELAALLSGFRQLTVLTNDIAVATEIAQTENNLIVAGGTLKRSSTTLLGLFTEQMLAELHVEKSFFSVDAVDPGNGFMDYNMDEVQIKRLMLRNAKQRMILCDYSKFYRSALVSVCLFSEVDVLITGGELDAAFLQKLAESNVKVIDTAAWEKGQETPKPENEAQEND